MISVENHILRLIRIAQSLETMLEADEISTNNLTRATHYILAYVVFDIIKLNLHTLIGPQYTSHNFATIETNTIETEFPYRPTNNFQENKLKQNYCRCRN